MVEAAMLALGIAYIAYAIIVEGRFKNLSPFSFLYVALSLLCFIAAAALLCGADTAGSILAAINVAIFLALLAGLIYISSATKSGNTPDTVEWIVVLGCLLRGDRPGSILTDRLDLTIGIARKYPNARIVVCGGKGPNELIPEAEAMFRYLTARDVEAERITKEEHSTSTMENLQNFLQIRGTEDAATIVITSDFHVPRTAKISKECGLGSVSYFYSKTPTWKWINCAIREAIALLLSATGIKRHDIRIAGKRL